MAIVFYVPALLREHTGGRNRVDIHAAAATVGEVLAELWREYPGLRDRIVTEKGDLRRHVNIFVGEENIRDCGGFAAAVRDGAAITIVPAVSGGSSRERSSGAALVTHPISRTGTAPAGPITGIRELALVQ